MKNLMLLLLLAYNRVVARDRKKEKVEKKRHTQTERIICKKGKKERSEKRHKKRGNDNSFAITAHWKSLHSKSYNVDCFSSSSTASEC